MALVGALLGGAAAAAFVLLGAGVAGLVAGNVLLGTGHLCSVVGEQALIANATPACRHDTAFGYRVGQVVVPSTAGLIAAGAGDGGVLVLTAAGLAAVGVAARRIAGSPPGVVVPTAVACRIVGSQFGPGPHS